MSDLFRLSDDQMRRIAPYFPLPPGVLRVDDRRIVSGIIVVIGNGLLAGRPCGLLSGQDDLHRFIRWSRMGCLTGYWRDWRSGVPGPPAPDLSTAPRNAGPTQATHPHRCGGVGEDRSLASA